MTKCRPGMPASIKEKNEEKEGSERKTGIRSASATRAEMGEESK